MTTHLNSDEVDEADIENQNENGATPIIVAEETTTPHDAVAHDAPAHDTSTEGEAAAGGSDSEQEEDISVIELNSS